MFLELRKKYLYNVSNRVNIIHVLFSCRIQHKNKVTPYLDMTLPGVVQRTFLAGREIYSRQKG